MRIGRKVILLAISLLERMDAKRAFSKVTL